MDVNHLHISDEQIDRINVYKNTETQALNTSETPKKIVVIKIPSFAKEKWFPDEKWLPTHVSDEYFISNYGRCYSEKVKTLKICNPTIVGYINYVLMLNGKKKSFLAHELVITAFIGPRPAEKYIDHIDRVKTNNKLDNLRYVTVSDNNLNRTVTHKRGKSCEQYDLNGNKIKKWEKAKDIADHYKLDLRILTKHIRIETPYKGYIYKYVSAVIVGEIWKDIELKTGKIKLSNHGRIIVGYYTASYGSKTSSGYRAFMVGDKTYLIHTLVCEHFGEPPPCLGAIANHLDENKENNHIDNLVWVSGIRENTEYSLGKLITQYDKLTGKLIAEYKSIRRAYEATNIPKTTIYRSCNGEDAKILSDFVFRYEGDTFTTIKGLVTVRRGKIVVQSTFDGKEIARFKSGAEVSRKFNIASSSISYFCNNNKFAKGFRWSYSCD